MNNVVGSLQEMVSSSILVLTQPSVASFERFEKRGNLKAALIYVAVAAALAGIFGLFNGPIGFIASVLNVVINFFVFTYATFYIGKQQGGTGTLDEVAYTFALFAAPLSVIGSIITIVLTITVVGIFLLPIVGIALLAAEIYFGFLAVQASMNISEPRRAWITLGLAALVSFVISIVVSGLLT